MGELPPVEGAAGEPEEPRLPPISPERPPLAVSLGAAVRDRPEAFGWTGFLAGKSSHALALLEARLRVSSALALGASARLEAQAGGTSREALALVSWSVSTDQRCSPLLVGGFGLREGALAHPVLELGVGAEIELTQRWALGPRLTLSVLEASWDATLSTSLNLILRIGPT